jgi:hypothetical protein
MLVALQGLIKMDSIKIIILRVNKDQTKTSISLIEIKLSIMKISRNLTM